MKIGFAKQVASYLTDHKKRKRLISLMCALSVFTVFTVYGALMQPAISMENNNIILEAEPAQAAFDEEMSVSIYAEALDDQPETVFLISAQSIGAGLTDEYVFTDDAAEILTEDDETVLLNRFVGEDGEMNYWFSLTTGTVVTFVLNCVSCDIIEKPAAEEETDDLDDEEVPDAETVTPGAVDVIPEDGAAEEGTEETIDPSEVPTSSEPETTEGETPAPAGEPAEAADEPQTEPTDAADEPQTESTDVADEPQTVPTEAADEPQTQPEPSIVYTEEVHHFGGEPVYEDAETSVIETISDESDADIPAGSEEDDPEEDIPETRISEEDNPAEDIPEADVPTDELPETVAEDLPEADTDDESEEDESNISDDQLTEKSLKLYSLSAPTLDEAIKDMAKYKEDRESDPLILTWMDKDVLKALDISEISLTTEKTSGLYGEVLTANIYAHASEFAKDDITFLIKGVGKGAMLTDEFLFVDGICQVKAADNTLIDLHLETADNGSSNIWFKLTPGVDETFSLSYIAQAPEEGSEISHKSMRLSAGYGTILSTALAATSASSPVAFTWSADGFYTISYAEQTLSTEASDGAKITVTGLIPEGVTVSAEPQDDVEIENETVIAAYDITLSFEGEEYQPESAVEVSIVLPEQKLSSTESTKVGVYHIADESETPECVAKAVDLTAPIDTPEADVTNTVEFEAESFSLYVVTVGESSYTLKKGNSVTVNDYITYPNSGYQIDSDNIKDNSSWSISPDDQNVTLSDKRKKSVTVSAADNAAAGTYTLTHQYKWRYYRGLNWYGPVTQTFTIIIPESQTLTTVETVDSTALGVTMRMFDYPNDYRLDFGSQGYTANIKQGLLSEKTTSNGFPKIKSNNVNLSTYFAKTASSYYKGEANHLFLKSEYDSTGDFYYNAADTFASYNNSGNFTVYNQLGTPGPNDVFYFKRGNFMPFNTLKVSSPINKNLYDYLGNPLKSTDERYNEDLYGFNENKNIHFGMYMEAEFIQPKDGIVNGKQMIFEFTGDDDMWIYIDGALVLDLGGIHDAQSGDINFATGEVRYTTTSNSTATWHTLKIENLFTNAEVNALFNDNGVFNNYTKHKIQMFYMERGEGASNLRMKFNLPTIPEKSIQVKKIVEGKGAAPNADYTMKLYVNNDGNGNDYTVKANATYKIGETSHTTASDGAFTLKSDQTATFPDIPENAKYYVEEIGTSDFNVTFNDAAGTVVEGTDTYQSGRISAYDIPSVTVTNTCKTGSLEFTKYGTNDGGDNAEKLEGVQFSLFTAVQDGDGEWSSFSPNADYSVTSSATGVVNFSDLPLGNYLMYETGVKSGYIAPTDPWRVSVTSEVTTLYYKDGAEWKAMENASGQYSILNYKAYDLPDTGGNGIGFLYFMGIMMMAGAGITYLYKKKQRVKGGANR